ncbi:hypothetical protein FOA43_004696 [Brettanomyces nanus]|uniref:Thioredoxin domain-containing protein n=1 Tax=Eeniella nana TaxID=13502 RepID=A0A875S8R2_EENNA|nr:uncharacterized protein FOA43_004696 [Brettanomyces nanus]QPG77288.1 hypothetical protein FOA43_004696 [Brettanomyces nanus]
MVLDWCKTKLLLKSDKSIYQGIDPKSTHDLRDYAVFSFLRFMIFLALLSWISAVVCAVTVVNDSNFEDVVFGKPGTFSLVYFNSPYCSYCRQLDPEYEPLGDLYRGTKLQVFKIDGLNNKRIRSKYHLVGFPVVRLFSSDGAQMGSYKGKRRTPEMMQYILEATGARPNKFTSYVTKIGKDGIQNYKDLTDRIFDENNNAKDTVVAFYEPWDSELGNPYNSYFERLAKYYSEEVNDNTVEFVGVDATLPESTDAVRFFQVGKYPMIFHLPKGADRYIAYRLDENLDATKIVSMISGKDIGQTRLNLKKLQDDVNMRIEEMERQDDDEDDEDQIPLYRDL